MKKKLLIALGIVVVLLVGGVLYVGYGLDPVVKGVVESAGTEALGKPVTLESATLRPFAGHVALTGLVLPNADGFEEPEFLSTGFVEVKARPMSFFSDTVEVSEITIDAPKITLEVSLQGSNLGAIQKKLEEKAGKKEKGEEPATSGDSKPLRMVVERIRVTQGTVVLAQSAFGKDREEFVLDEFVIEDLHSEDAEKVTTMPRILQRVVAGVLEQVAKKNDLPPEVLQVLQQGGLPGLDEVQNQMEKAGKHLEKLPNEVQKGLIPGKDG